MSSEFEIPTTLLLTDEQLDAVNTHLRSLDGPQAVLSWAIAHLPSIYQTTAFGLTGCAGVDMLSKLTTSPPPLIFIDTLHHFPETLQLVKQFEERYGTSVIVYKPEGCETADDFEKKYGPNLWETDGDTYDFAVKAEPAQRAYAELGVKVALTGRRASQGADRASLPPLERDKTGLLKLNPFYAWSFSQVKSYIDENNVPKNGLLDQGYKSIGDWHSTQKSDPAAGDAGERAGRWAGQQKTECGLHKDYFAMKAALAKKKREEEAATKAAQIAADATADASKPSANSAMETNRSLPIATA